MGRSWLSGPATGHLLRAGAVPIPSLRALRHGPLTGIDLPAGHLRGDGNTIEIVGDDLDVIGGGLGDENCPRSGRPPAPQTASSLTLPG